MLVVVVVVVEPIVWSLGLAAVAGVEVASVPWAHATCGFNTAPALKTAAKINDCFMRLFLPSVPRD